MQLLLKIFLTSVGFMLLIEKCSESKKDDSCCLDILDYEYESNEPPRNKGNTGVIYVALQVLDIGEIDEGKMDYLFHVFVNTAWRDSRLKFSALNITKYPMFLHECCLRYIWEPDIYFETVKHIESFQGLTTDALLEVFQDETVFKSRRYLFKAGCNMDFTLYPFDVQNCLFLVGLMHPDSEAVLKWIDDENSPYRDMIDVIEMVRQPEPLQFYLLKPTPHSVTEVFGDRAYTTLIANITLVRRLTGSIINTYVPSTLIVIMSWVTFWIETTAVPARVALSITSLLTLCTQVEQYKSQFPPVSYMKAMDIWLFVCIFMVFSTLVEFAFAYNLSIQLCKNCSILKNDKRPNQPIGSVKIQDWLRDIKHSTKIVCSTSKEIRNHQTASSKQTVPKISAAFCEADSEFCSVNKRRSQSVDNLSKKLFPLFFITFAIVYWAYFLNKSSILHLYVMMSFSLLPLFYS